MTPSKPFAWSWSSLSQFETCPYQYHEIRVVKTAKDTKGEEALWGDFVHKEFDAYLKGGNRLPPTLQVHTRMLDKVIQAPGQTLGEQQIAINAKFEPVTWFAKDAWCRGIIDAGKIHERHGRLLDWKTGKRKPSEQLALFAGLGFCQWPQLETVDTAFVWLPAKALDREAFTREQTAEIWSKFLPRVHRIEQAIATDRWPKKPSGLCRMYCPVTHCEHNGRR